MALNCVKWNINTPEGISPASITVEDKSKDLPAYTTGTSYSLLLNDKSISCFCVGVKKTFLGINGAEKWFYYTYSFSNDPEKWAREYEIHIYDVNGRSIENIANDIEIHISPWKIEIPANRAAHKIREWDRTSSLIDVLNEFGDMIGCYPTLNHFERKIIYLDLDTKFLGVNKIDSLIESTTENTIYSCELTEVCTPNSGIRLLGFYNSRFTQAIDSLIMSFPGGAWSVELLNAETTHLYQSCSGSFVESNNGVAMAYFLVSTKFQLSSYMLDLSKTPLFTFAGWKIRPWKTNYSSINALLSNSFEVTEWDVYVPWDFFEIKEAWVYPIESTNEIGITVHVGFPISVPIDWTSFYLVAEQEVREWLSSKVFKIEFNSIRTGDFFDKYAGAEPFENIVVEFIPPKPTSSAVEISQKLIDKIWFFKNNRKRLRITTDEGILINGNLYTSNEKSGLILSNSSEWSSENNKIFSSIEVIV